LAVVVGEGIAVEVTVLKSLGLTPPDALHALAAFLGLFAVAFLLLLAGADAPGPESAALEWVRDNRLPGAAALPAMNQVVSRVKIFVLVEFNQIVSPSFTL
jgi:hypothetical protein